MIIRLDHSFVKLLDSLDTPFTEMDKQKLVQSLEENYERIMEAIRSQEEKKENSEPEIIELSKIGSRQFNLNIFYYGTSLNTTSGTASIDATDDVPISVKGVLPTVSPVRIDVMVNTLSSNENKEVTYIKAAEVYDDGDIDAKYLDEIEEQDQGTRPTDL